MNARVVPTRWTIAFDGRDRGFVNTIARSDVPRDVAIFRRDYVLDLVASQSLFAAPSPNASRETTSAFAGWCEHDATRPLVVVSDARATDPDQWHRQQPAAAETSRAFALFKVRADSAQYCPKGDEVSTPLHVRPNDVEIVSAYIDARGRRLIGIRIKPQLRKCDGPPEDAWHVHWYAVTNAVRNNARNDARFIGRSMSLIDVGDYDGDGVSELLFWFSAYNRDGYVLMHSDFRGRVEYLWSYH